MKRVANAGNENKRVPSVVGPVQIQLAVAIVAPEINHVRVAIHDKQLCTKYRLSRHHPSNTLGIVSYSGS